MRVVEEREKTSAICVRARRREQRLLLLSFSTPLLAPSRSHSAAMIVARPSTTRLTALLGMTCGNDDNKRYNRPLALLEPE